MSIFTRGFCYGLAVFMLLKLTVPAFGASELKKGGWDEIPQEELDAVAPRIDPDAHCEFTLRKVRIDDSSGGASYFYHYRAKVFTEAGVKAWDKVDLSYGQGWKVSGIRARVIFPDGSVALLDRSDIYKRKIFENEHFKGYAKSFSFPGLKVGCIIEYKWRLSRQYGFAEVLVELRAEWPTWSYHVRVTPFRARAASIRAFNGKFALKKKMGRFELSIENQPARSNKPYLAPRKDFEPFFTLDYAFSTQALGQDKYWNYRGGNLESINDHMVRPKSSKVKKLAAQLFDGIRFPEDRLRRAYEYCTEEITNISEYTDRFTEQELDELDENDSPNDTIRNGYGTRWDIAGLFASLAGAAGFKARLVQVEDQEDCTFFKRRLGAFNLSGMLVGVRKADKSWRYFDPGSSFLPFEVLNPGNAGSVTLVEYGGYFNFYETPDVARDFSQLARIADVSINEYGDLEGLVQMQCKGYSGLWRKRLFVDMTTKEMETHVLETEWTQRIPRAVVSDFEVFNADSTYEHLVLKYRIRIPGYADVLGDRLILNPSLFEHGSKPLFVDEERTEHIRFPYLQMIRDKVTISVPEGFRFEASSGATSAFRGRLFDRKSLTIENPDSGELVYQREFASKQKNVAASYYSLVKEEFDYLSTADNRPITLTRNAESAEEVAFAQ